MNYDAPENNNPAIQRAQDLAKKIPVKLRVKLGHALLDAYEGDKAAIDPDRIYIGSSGTCVLGQTFGEYAEGLDRLGLSLADGYLFGFNSDYSEYDALKERWIKELAK